MRIIVNKELIARCPFCKSHKAEETPCAHFIGKMGDVDIWRDDFVSLHTILGVMGELVFQDEISKLIAKILLKDIPFWENIYKYNYDDAIDAFCKEHPFIQAVTITDAGDIAFFINPDKYQEAIRGIKKTIAVFFEIDRIYMKGNTWGIIQWPAEFEPRMHEYCIFPDFPKYYDDRFYVLWAAKEARIDSGEIRSIIDDLYEPTEWVPSSKPSDVWMYLIKRQDIEEEHWELKDGILYLTTVVKYKGRKSMKLTYDECFADIYDTIDVSVIRCKHPKTVIKIDHPPKRPKRLRLKEKQRQLFNQMDKLQSVEHESNLLQSKNAKLANNIARLEEEIEIIENE